MKNHFAAILFFSAVLLCQPAIAAWTVRYVDASAAGGGDGTTTATSGGTGAWTLAEAATASNTSPGMQINIKAGNYSPGAIAFSDDGSAGSPIWFRGYNTTPGDCDAFDGALPTLPAIDMSTNQLSCTGAYNWFSGLNVTGATTTANGQVLINDVDHLMWNCKVACTAANSNGRALTVASSGTGSRFMNVLFTATTTASVMVQITPVSVSLSGCVFRGSSIGISTAGETTIARCIFDDQSSHAIQCSVDANVSQCSIYSPGGDGIRLLSTAGSGEIRNNIFESCGAYAVNSSAGTVASVLIVHNGYYNSTTADLNGVVESQQIGDVSLASSPFTNAASDDFTLTSGTTAKGAGAPGYVVDINNIGYPDLGALQTEAGGSNTYSRSRVVNQ